MRDKRVQILSINLASDDARLLTQREGINNRSSSTSKLSRTATDQCKMYFIFRLQFIYSIILQFKQISIINGLTLNSQYSCSNVCTGLRLHTSPMNLVVQLIP